MGTVREERVERVGRSSKDVALTFHRPSLVRDRLDSLKFKLKDLPVLVAVTRHCLMERLVGVVPLPRDFRCQTNYVYPPTPPSSVRGDLHYTSRVGRATVIGEEEGVEES